MKEGQLKPIEQPNAQGITPQDQKDQARFDNESPAYVPENLPIPEQTPSWMKESNWEKDPEKAHKEALKINDKIKQAQELIETLKNDGESSKPARKPRKKKEPASIEQEAATIEPKPEQSEVATESEGREEISAESESAESDWEGLTPEEKIEQADTWDKLSEGIEELGHVIYDDKEFTSETILQAIEIIKQTVDPEARERRLNKKFLQEAGIAAKVRELLENGESGEEEVSESTAPIVESQSEVAPKANTNITPENNPEQATPVAPSREKPATQTPPAPVEWQDQVLQGREARPEDQVIAMQEELERERNKKISTRIKEKVVGRINQAGDKIGQGLNRVVEKAGNAKREVLSWPARFKNYTLERYQKAKSKYEKTKNDHPALAFAIERAKGLATFGWWDFHQAEKFRVGTKEAAENTKEIAENIRETSNLSLDEAIKEWEQMNLMRGILEKEGRQDFTKEEYETMDKEITRQKIHENQKWEDMAVERAMKDLEDKLENNSIIQGYRTAHTGKEISYEQGEALRAELHVEMKKLRDGRIRRDLISYKGVMRKNLDKDWYARYLYGGVETALAAAGWMWAGPKLASYLGEWYGKKFMASKVASGAIPTPSGTELHTLPSHTPGTHYAPGGELAPDPGITQEMNKNIWHTLQEIGKQHGKTFSDAQLKNFSQQVMSDAHNRMFEKQWTDMGRAIAQGLKSSRSLPVGQKLYIPIEVIKAMAL